MKEKAIQIILEYFEWNEICNQDWGYSEKANLERAENIYEEFIDSIDEFLIDNYKK